MEHLDYERTWLRGMLALLPILVIGGFPSIDPTAGRNE